jgi:hypothetical protein
LHLFGAFAARHPGCFPIEVRFSTICTAAAVLRIAEPSRKRNPAASARRCSSGKSASIGV